MMKQGKDIFANDGRIEKSKKKQQKKHEAEEETKRGTQNRQYSRGKVIISKRHRDKVPL